MHRIAALRIEITNKCPLACCHCSVSAGPGKNEMIETGRALSLIEQFAQQGGNHLVVTGGEPLTHPDCDQFVEAARELGLSTTLFSMGVVEGMELVPTQLLTKLARSLDVWRVSLHAPDATTHDGLTMIPGSFSATCVAIERIRSAGISVYATFFAYPKNVSLLRGVAELCRGLGIGELRVLTVVPQGRAAAKPDPLRLDPAQVVKALSAATEVAGVRVRLGEAARARSGDSSECRAIREELVVNWDGWISPCHSVEPQPSSSDLDNALRTRLHEVLQNSPRLQLCRDLAMRSAETCEGGCRARQALLG